MPITSGVFNITQNPNELNMRSFAQHMIHLYPNGSAPMFGITALNGRAKAKSTTHGYFSKTLSFVDTTITTQTSTTEWILGSVAGIAANQVLHVLSTGENIRVTAVNTSSNTVTITRGFGRIPETAPTDGDKVIMVGTAFAEGSARPVARRLATVYIPNFTQIFRDAWALTDTARASMSENGYDNVANDRRDCALFHSISLETAIIWGQPIMDTTGEQPVHATQGVLDAMAQYAPGNINTAGATTTFDQLVSMIEPAFEFSADIGNPTERVAFGGSQAIRVLTEIGRQYGDVTLTQDETSFGMKFTSFKTYKGTIHLKEHPLMNGLDTRDNLLILDPAALKLAYLEGRDTKAEEYGDGGKLLENGTDGVGGSLTTECAVELINPYACAQIKGLTAAAI